MKVLRDESGQTLVFVAVSLTVLMGFLAFAADLGLQFHDQRNMQIAADATAVAAALDYKYNGSKSSALSAGQAAATANGVTNGVNGAVVTINCSPLSGSETNAGGACNGFFEAIVSQPNSTLFMGVLKRNSMTVAARAVAGAGTASGCFYGLGTSGIDIPISGSGSLVAPGCPVYDNSNSYDALDLSGSGSSAGGKPDYVVAADDSDRNGYLARHL
jgi:Flp pilus assembly protein TadG